MTAVDELAVHERLLLPQMLWFGSDNKTPKPLGHTFTPHAESDSEEEEVEDSDLDDGRSGSIEVGGMLGEIAAEDVSMHSDD